MLVSGFTLIELLVVTGIITILTLLILARHGEFNNTVLLRSLAYDVALSVRQAQVYELSTREVAIGSGVFGGGYGIYFSSANPTTYILFADINKNSAYDGEGESVEVFSVKAPYGIAKFCAITAGGAEHCAPCATGCTALASALSVAFSRPNPDAIIKTDIGSSYGSAVITVESPTGVRKEVAVASTGQISVRDPQ